MKKLSILDFGAGNLRSIYNAFKRLDGIDVRVTSSSKDIALTDYLVMPGQGAYNKVAHNLNSTEGLIDAIMSHVEIRRMPFMGICVGMQLLSDCGYENGVTRGLSLISGQVKKIVASDNNTLKVILSILETAN